MTRLAGPLLTALIAATALPGAAAERAFTVPLPARDAFELDLPESWKVEVRPAPGMPPTLAIQLPSGAVLQVTPLIDPERREGRFADADARAAAGRAADGVKPGSVEPELALHALAGARGTVHWFSATDKAPKPGEFEHLTMGASAVDGKVMAFFTLLHHEAVPPDREAVLRAIGGARVVAGAPPAPRPRLDPYALALGGRGWALLADLPGFELGELERSEDGRSLRVQGASADRKLNVSLMLRPFEGASPAACRSAHAEFLASLPFEQVDVKRWERPGLAVTEYLNPRIEGQEIRQRHLQAYLAREDVCATVHLSKVLWEPADQARFDAVVKTIRIGALPAP